MPRDRTGDEQDDLFTGPHPKGCEHGVIEEHYDAAGNLIAHGVEGIDPNVKPHVHRSVTFPCPRCRPAQHARWSAGCWSTDGGHDFKNCTYCQEDGRHAPRIGR